MMNTATTVKNMVNQSWYVMIDMLASRVVNMVAFILLTHILAPKDIGIIGIALGYIVIVNYLAVRPESILLRENLHETGRMITAYLAFWAVRSILLLGITAAISWFLWYLRNDMLLSLFFLLFGVASVITMLADLWSFLLFVHVKQHQVFIINIFTAFLNLGLVLILFLIPHILFYGTLLIITAAIKSFICMLVYIAQHPFKPSFIGLFPEIKRNLMSFSLWQHLGTITMTWMFYLDTIILGLFISLEIIGDYTIAMKIAFITFNLALLLERVMSTTYKELSDEELPKYVGSFVKYFLTKGIASILLFLVFGEWIIKAMFGTSDLEFTSNITLILLLGTAILTLAWPFVSVIISRYSMKKYVVWIILPVMVLSACFMGAATWLFGAYGTAWSNVIIYSIFLALVVIFTRKTGIQFSRQLDRQIFKEYLKRLLPRKVRQKHAG